MSSSEEVPFLVIGAGVAGLAAALALASRGHEILVLESSPTLGEIGAGIQLAPNALRVLDELGVLEDVFANAVHPPMARMRDARTGAVITSMDLGEAFVAQFGYPYIVTHRADLHASLLRACEATGQVTVLTGCTAVSIDESDDVVIVVTLGGDRYRGQVVVGADGLRSCVREYTIGDGSAVPAGDVAYRGTAAIDQIPLRDGITDMTWWVGPSMHLIQYPVRGGELFNQVAVITPDGLTDSRDQAVREAFGTESDLDELFRGTYDHVSAGVGLLNRDQCWQLFDRPPVTSWTRGRVTLMGDAAHPMLQYAAQGGCQALEDAVVLAASFDAHPTDPRLALEAYERERIPRTSAVQTWARRIGEIVHADSTLALVRDALLSHRADDDYGYVDWLYGYRRPGS